MSIRQGSVYQRKDGRWCAVVYVNEKPKVLYARTERAVRQRATDFIGQVAKVGFVPNPGRRTVADLLSAWLDCAELRPKTIEGYKYTMSLILPVLGHIRLSRLEPIHLQNLYADLAKASKRNAYRAHLLLNHALKLAVLWSWLAFNPAERVVKPKYQIKRKSIWTVEQMHAFLSGTSTHRYHPLWMLAICTGCRLGELLGLKWPDVDLIGGAVAIRRNLQYIKGKWVESPPKTKAGERYITLPSEAIAALRRQKAQQNEWKLKVGKDWQDGELVFTSPTGRPVQQNWVQNAMQAECQRLCLPKLTPHNLRHLHASLLLDKGLPITLVSQRLGHANPSITMTIYAHALKRQDEEAARAMSEVLRKMGTISV